MDDYQAWVARMAAAVAAVPCPRCKAPAGTPCSWGVTHGGHDVHTPRLRAATKKGT